MRNGLVFGAAAVIAAFLGCSSSINTQGTTSSGTGGLGGGSSSSSSSSGSMACVPGQQIACACPGGSTGVQVCNAAGTAYGACACGGTGGMGTGGFNIGGTGAPPPPFCMPGEVQPCYTGPNGTMGVGVCKAGQQTCLPDGSAYGACTGQVLPSPDLCSTPVDEDCDGSATPCVQDPTWCHAVPVTSSGDGPLGLAVDGAGDVYFALQASNVDFGQGVLNGTILAKLDPAGHALWNKTLPNPPFTLLAAGADGSVVVAGFFGGVVDFGAGPMACPGASHCPYVARFAPDGALVFSKAYFPSSGGWAGGLLAGKIDDAGNIALAGFLQGTFACGGQTLQAFGQDPFVVKLSPTGDCLWALQAGATGGVIGSVDVDAAGNVLVAGLADGPVSLGGLPFGAPGSFNLFVTKLDPTGKALFSRPLGGAGGLTIYARFAPLGAVGVAGTFNGTIDLGGGPITATPAGDVFLGALDATGQHLWSHGYGSGSQERVIGLGATPAGGLIMTGYFQNLADFGSGALHSAGFQDIFLARYDAAGAPLASARYGDINPDLVQGLVTNKNGTPIITGGFSGNLDVGAGPVTPNAGIFLCQLGQ